MTDWLALSEKELLSLRFRDLGLTISGDLLTKSLAALEGELEARGFRFRPHVWLSDEWFCPDGVPGFAIPFYLTHPRLTRLERSQMLEVEGGTPRSCLRLLRHETGHAVDNAYRLRLRRRRQEMFGRSQRAYPGTYAPRPFSRSFVRHLEQNYAQSHPDEDFAETFAVWLDPDSRWRERYAGWPASEKLSYMNELMNEIAECRPLTTNRRRPDELTKLNRTLGGHYRLQRKRYKVKFGERYDAALDDIFSQQGELPAATFLRRHRSVLRRLVAERTGARCYTVDDVLKLWIGRSRTRARFVKGTEPDTMADVAASLSVHVMQYVEKGHYRIPL